MSEQKSYINTIESEFGNSVYISANLDAKFILPKSGKKLYCASIFISVGSDFVWFGSSLVYRKIDFLELDNGEFGMILSYAIKEGARKDDKLLCRIYDIKNPKGLMKIIVENIINTINSMNHDEFKDGMTIFEKRYSTIEPYNEIKGDEMDGK